MAQTPSAKEPPSCESGPEWSDIDRLRCLASRAPSSKSASCIACAPKGWKTYVNRVHGFCISYPPIYKQRTPPFLFTDSSRYAAYLRKAADDGRVLVLERIGDKDVTILVRLDEKLDRSAPIQAFGLFDLHSFIKAAPTGVESPPEPLQVGGEKFYYYGPGGGGVDYADQYFFNLKGKTLYISFDGPYGSDAHEKGPSYETKQMEIQMLSSFRKF